jgi:hypothetical protein
MSSLRGPFKHIHKKQLHSEWRRERKSVEQTGIGEGIINDQDTEQKGKDYFFQL